MSEELQFLRGAVRPPYHSDVQPKEPETSAHTVGLFSTPTAFHSCGDRLYNKKQS